MKTSNAAIFAVSSLVFLSQSLPANPLGGLVVNGSASINGGGSLLTISQTSPTAIINWNSFSIGQGQSTIFQFNGHAGAHSAVLNEVNSGNPSVIAGLLESTVGVGGPVGGTVLVLNPSGILFSSTAQINVGSLTASTLGLADNNEFLNSRTLHLSGNSTAGIQNQGNLSALGDIYLIANTVQNSGSITAGDHVGLAAGTQVTLMQSGSERLTVTAGSGTGTAVGVNNTAAGQINATVAELAAAGGNIYALAINNAGAVRATTVTHEGGAIYLRANGGAVANSGILNASGAASGAKGGLVQVTGGNISLTSSSAINVSGDAGGGTVLVGGGAHGTDPSVPDAQQTTVAAGATISADASTLGNGGKVVVWGDSDSFAGSITARGGSIGGNGGSVEVSGHQLAFTGLVGTQAPNGKAGNLLLDPDDLNIDNGTDTGVNPITGGIITPTGGATPPSELTWSTIYTDLQSGNNVTVKTTSGFIDVTATGTIPATSTGNLTLEAGGALNVNASIVNNGGGNLTLQSGTGDLAISAGAPITLNSFNGSAPVLTLNSPENITIGADLSASSLVAQSGSAGGVTGNISWTTSGLTVSANSQSYQAGNNGATASAVNLVGDAPTFLGTAGVATTPTAFTYRQDATINDANIPLLTQFGPGTLSALPSTLAYTIQSDGGDITLATGASVAGSALTLKAPNGTLSIDDNLTLASLSASASVIDLKGTGGSEVVTTTGGDQNYAGAVTLEANTTLNGGTVELPTVDGGFALTITGAATLEGAVGSVTPLTSLTLNNAVTLDGPSITTTGAQSYDGAVTLAGNNTLSGSSLAFNSTVDGGFALTINGPATLGGAVGSLTPLAALTLNNAVTLDGPSITTTGAQSYDGTVTLAGNDTLSGSSVGFNSTVDGGFALTVNGPATLSAAVGSLTPLASLTLNGTATLDGPTVTTTGAQSYDGAVTLAGNNTLSGSSVALNGGANGAHSLTIAGPATLGGVIGGVTPLTSLTLNNAVTLDGPSITTTGAQSYDGTVTLAGNDTLSGSSVGFNSTVDGGFALTVNGPATLSAAVGSLTPLASLTLNGAATLDGPTVTTTGAQSYDGAVTLAGNNTLSGSTVGLNSTVDGAYTLTVNGTATLGGVVGGLTPLTSLTLNNASTLDGPSVTTTGAQNYDGAVTLAADNTLSGSSVALNGGANGAHNLTIAGPAILGGVIGGVTPLTSLTLNNAVTLDGPSITTTGAQSYDGTVTLAGNDILSGSSVGFNSTVDGGFALTVNGPATLSAAVGSLTPLASLTLNGAATLDGPTVTTTGAQSYDGAVTLAANNTLSGSSVALNSGVNGAHNLVVTGTATLEGAVGSVTPLTSLTLNNAVTLDGPSITTTGAQSYDGAVTLAGNNTLSGSSLAFNSTVDGGFALTVNGPATLGAAVGSLTPLAALTLNNAVTLDGPSITTTGAQSYGGTVTLAGNDTLSGSSVGFNSTVDGGFALTVNGPATLSAAVGSLTPLASLTLNNAVTLDGPSITTTGAQSYDGAVTLAGNNTLSGSSVALNGGANGAHSLTIAGPATLGGVIGGVTPLTSLTLNNAVTLDGPSITTTGAQSYDGTVTLAGNDTLSGSSVGFNSTVDGGFALTVNGPATLSAAVGSLTPLASLTLNGAATLDGPTVTTTGAQSYDGAVTLAGNNTLSGSTVGLNSTVDGAYTLTVNGTATLGGVVGGLTPLTSLTLNNASTLDGPSVTTTGAQNYDGAVTLAGNNTLSGSSIGLNATVNGPFALTVNGPATLGGAVGSVAPLASLTLNNAATLDGPSVTTTGAQNYDGAVTLAGNNTLSGSTVGLNATVDGGFALTVNGPATLGGAVGSVTPLASLTLNNAATLDGPSVTTTGAQNYDGAVTLAANNTLSGSSVALNSTVNGGYALTVFGTATLGGAVGGLTPLTSLTLNNAATIGGPTVTTTGTQTYDGAVNLTGNVILTESSVDLESTVSGGGHSLTLNNSGLATLNGAVSGVNLLTADGAGGTLLANSTIAAANVTDTEATTLSGGSVTTSGGDQNYTGAVTLGADTTLTSGTIELATVAGGTHNLTLDNSGTATLNGVVSGVQALSISGASQLDGGSVTTSAGQSYGGEMTLGAATTLSGTTLTLSGVAGGGNNLTLDNSGLATLNGAVNGVNLLTADGAGGTLLATSTITAANLADTEATTLNGGSVTTTGGDQNYTGAVTLGADTTLTSGTIELAAVTGGSHSLTLDNSGLATLNGAVSGVNLLTADGTGGTILANNTIAAANFADNEATTLSGGSVTTTGGDQNYTGTVTLGADMTLASGTIEMATVSGGGHNLTLDNSGTATLNGPVSGVGLLTANGVGGTLLADSTITAANVTDTEATTLSGGSVTTTGGDQNYTGTVTLGADTTLTSGTIELATVAGGTHNLTLDNSGTATLNGVVSGVQALSISGASQLDGGSVTTSAGQSYGAITLGAPTHLVGSSVKYSSLTTDGNSFLVGDVDEPVLGTEAGTIFGALQRRERQPRATNPQMNAAPSLIFPTLVPVASSYPTRLRDAQL